MAKPKLIVFDLDYTLWPYWCDTHITAPFKKNKDGKVYDRHGQHVESYPEVTEVLESLKQEGYILGVASRTGEVRGANQLISHFGWESYFSFKEIYIGRKTTHFSRIRNDSGLDYSQMLFFDDEMRNKVDLDKIGVLMYLIDERTGVNKAAIKEGLQLFANRAATGT